jgi:ribosomal protein S18 acetylase RimI-like enzyme
VTCKYTHHHGWPGTKGFIDIFTRSHRTPNCCAKAFLENYGLGKTAHYLFARPQKSRDMTQFLSRTAADTDAATITGLLKRMVEEIASLGGYAVSQDPDVWKQFEGAIERSAQQEDNVLIVACPSDNSEEVIGFVSGYIKTLEPLFEPRRILHISAIYVLALHRRQGVARMLMHEALEWGRNHQCVEAELNTLVTNPARKLYEKVGFAESELTMIHII